jgi:hypothetical protein
MASSDGSNVGTTQEQRRGNGKKPQENYLPLPKMYLMGVAKGEQQERARILAILDAESDNGPVNHIIHLITKDVSK